MPAIYLALGSNQGDRLALLGEALALLPPAVAVGACSPVYETAAAYVEDQPPFYNCVVAAATELAPGALLAALKSIEHELGRRAGQRYGPRPIDLDILLYGDLILETPELTIPHPRMAERAFVLVPLLEIAPHLPYGEALDALDR
ncbi:MAG TPA: 2-amino-4-hydroxy-6-hydroxymethyldihydropteridine diphosphokinase, partial [Herpetosiphonaceae bacterium]